MVATRTENAFPSETSDFAHVRGLKTNGDSVKHPIADFNTQSYRWIADYERSIANEINVLRYISDPDAASANTAALQTMIDDLNSDFVATGKGGVIRLPPYIQYKLGASTSTTTYYNGSSTVAASTGCLILKKGVSIVGPGRFSCAGLQSTDPSKTIIYMIEPNQVVLEGFRLSNAWTYGTSGAGHGVLSLKTADGIDTGALTHRVVMNDLWVNNVASYGLSFQNGMPQGCQISNCDIEYTGADGLDLKARYQTVQAYMNKAYNIRVRNHGSRVTGSAGIDVRGSWHLDNVDVAEFGALNAALDYVGVRFRTKSDPLLGEPDGSFSTLSNFRIDCTASLSTTTDGIQSGSDDVTISAGYVSGGRYGVTLVGNVNGPPRRNTVAGVHTQSCGTYGFYLTSGGDRNTFIGCSSDSSGTAGIRNEADYTTIVGQQSSNETMKSTSVGASATEVLVGPISGGYAFTTENPASGRVRSTAVGPDANLDYEMSVKGTGIFRFNQSSGVAAATTPSNFTADRIWQVRINGSVGYIPYRASSW